MGFSNWYEVITKLFRLTGTYKLGRIFFYSMLVLAYTLEKYCAHLKNIQRLAYQHGLLK